MENVKTVAQIRLEHMAESSPSTMMLAPEREVLILRKLSVPRDFCTYGNRLTALASESYRAGIRTALRALGLDEKEKRPSVLEHGQALGK